MSRTKFLAISASVLFFCIGSSELSAQCFSGKNFQGFSSRNYQANSANLRVRMAGWPSHQYEPTRNFLRSTSHGWGRGHHYRTPAYDSSYYNPWSAVNTPRYSTGYSFDPYSGSGQHVPANSYGPGSHQFDYSCEIAPANSFNSAPAPVREPTPATDSGSELTPPTDDSSGEIKWLDDGEESASDNGSQNR